MGRWFSSLSMAALAERQGDDHGSKRERDMDKNPDLSAGTVMSSRQERALVVEDEALIADLWCMILDDMGLDVCGTATTAEVAIALARTHRPKIVLMDVRLRGELDGVDAALAIHESVGSKVIFITGSKDPSTSARIQLDHPSAVLFKPVSDRQLKAAVRAALAG
jgi:two-component system, response regulator PdtaR